MPHLPQSGQSDVREQACLHCILRDIPWRAGLSWGFMYQQDQWAIDYQIRRPRGDEALRSQCEVGRQ